MNIHVIQYLSFLYRVIMIRCDDFKNKYNWIVSGGPNINGHRFVKPTSAIQVHVEKLYRIQGMFGLFDLLLKLILSRKLHVKLMKYWALKTFKLPYKHCVNLICVKSLPTW